MSQVEYRNALIVGAGSGLSASLARLFAKTGMKVAIAARRLDNLAAQAAGGAPDVVVYNASYRTRGPFIELDPAEVERSLIVTAFGGFLIAQEAAKRMVPKARGAILFTGASASVKGYAQSAPFAMGKFALRGLAQSMARELSPQGIHVGHVVVDGGIRSARRVEAPDKPDSMLDPEAIAQSYLDLLRQNRSAWSWEIEVRPWVEKF
jgi:NAD(P)-dependent dehydrogenase (short-subunit alcohol dehydrogenase family)